MKRPLMVLFAAAALAAGQVQEKTSGNTPAAADPPFWSRMKQVIEMHLGKPYVWGASGLKSFDCSGFLWRVMVENGILMKRTTARKFYMCLPKARPDQIWTAGNIVFFDDLKHCGIVAGPTQFYHSQTSLGTNLSPFDPYWRRKIYGFRTLPISK